VLGALTLSLTWLGLRDTQVTTISFLTLAFSQLWHVFNMRDFRSSLLVNEISRNFFIWAALGLCILLLLGAVYTPGLSGILKITRPGPEGWLLIITMSLIPLLIGQLRLILRGFRVKRRIKG
jgi:Ca2+-transporting ATPase